MSTGTFASTLPICCSQHAGRLARTYPTVFRSARIRAALPRPVEAQLIAQAQDFAVRGGSSFCSVAVMCVTLRCRVSTQATEAIRAQDGPNRDTPIVAVTANAMKGDRDKVPPSCAAAFHQPTVNRRRICITSEPT